MNLIEVPALFVDNFWPLARDLIESACERSDGRYRVDDVLKLIMDGRMQLWIINENHVVYGIALAEIVVFPRLRECRILAATGKGADDWVHLVERVEAWAKEQGCTKILAVTRPGWEKLMKPYGYKKNHVQMEKDLGYVH